MGNGVSLGCLNSKDVGDSILRKLNLVIAGINGKLGQEIRRHFLGKVNKIIGGGRSLDSADYIIGEMPEFDGNNTVGIITNANYEIEERA